MKTYVRTEVYNHAEQKILIQPTPEFNGIEIYTQEVDGTYCSNAFFIVKEELPVIIDKLQEMMNYVV